MKIKEARLQLIESLKELYGNREAAAIVKLVMEHLTGMENSALLVKEDSELTDKESMLYVEIAGKLKNHLPVQYAIGKTWFYNRAFKTGPGVLIPRPETEELTDLIIKDYRTGKNSPVILDIGTGSGNIAVTLSVEIPAKVYSCDISEAALAIAAENVQNYEAAVSLLKLSILNEENWPPLPEVDIIVSNPPYVSIEEKESLDAHVIGHEPSIALFPPGSDALIFYKKIALLGLQKLRPEGRIYVEINSVYGKETLDIFLQKGYRAELISDLYGKERIIKCIREQHPD